MSLRLTMSPRKLQLMGERLLSRRWRSTRSAGWRTLKIAREISSESCRAILRLHKNENIFCSAPAELDTPGKGCPSVTLSEAEGLLVLWARRSFASLRLTGRHFLPCSGQPSLMHGLT